MATPQPAPLDVRVGGGSDPLVFGLPVFVAGSLVLGFALVGWVAIPGGLGSVLPETTFAAGVGEFTTALWAIIVGQSMVAAIFGLFGVFWFSLFVLISGIFNDCVDLAVLFNLLAITLAAPLFFVLAGISVLCFCAIGLYAFLNVAWTSTGARRSFPPLGPPLLR
ncbi:hypothetical protein [Pseudonocardia endophytica]|uniref:Uncharacterized protein n=1 Tax=Pseudonocardia endophytica TaxID=401976 RepID=A0A4R1HXQ2_PSEEN|nr:hypothetical protein [Pseudonocardia endophytica]TCK27574.1 hypothetical protein EV378_3446 [Pseudonocardia endophytica]